MDPRDRPPRSGRDGARARAVGEALADVVGALCHTPVVGFEHMFETEEG